MKIVSPKPAAASPSRRRFIQSSAALSGALIIGFHLPQAGRMAHAQAPKPATPPNAFIRVGKDNSVTVLVKHLEFGQGVLTSLPMLVAEELGCDWKNVKSELAPAAPAYAHTAFGIQMTGGSTSVNDSWVQLRTAGAQARTMLVAAAAEQWKVKAADCKVANGMVTGPGGKKASFGQLVDAANKQPIPEKVDLKSSNFTIVGKPTRRIDAAGKVNGRAKFGIDVGKKDVPNLHTALVMRPPVFGARVKKFDASKVDGTPGVTHVVQTSNGVAVVAKSYWAAKQGRDKLVVEWDIPAEAKINSDALAKSFRETAQKPGIPTVKKAANAEAMKSAKRTLTAEYSVPYLAHAPMEPLNAIVQVTADGAKVWAGTQFQTVDQGAIARVLGIPPEKVQLSTLIAGGGFGRRANPASDYMVEAAEIAKAAKVPVKVVWSREDDIKGGYYRPAYAHRVEVGLDDKGAMVAWNHTIVGQSILAGTAFEAFLVKDGIDATSVEGVADTHYDIPNMTATLHSVKSTVPVLWWRSVGHTHTAFVMETMLDELARAANVDPVEYRRRLLAKNPRMLATLNLAAEKAGWGKGKLAAGRALGIAVHESFGSVCAQVAEVSVNKDEVRVHRVVAAVDCGIVVNPLSARAQVEGAIAYGLTAALYSNITFKDGEVQQSNFHDYPILRMPDMPTVEVHFVPSTNPPSGLGEPGLPPLAPAVANAIATLTNKRIRSMPFPAALA